MQAIYFSRIPLFFHTYAAWLYFSRVVFSRDSLLFTTAFFRVIFSRDSSNSMISTLDIHMFGIACDWLFHVINFTQNGRGTYANIFCGYSVTCNTARRPLEQWNITVQFPNIALVFDIFREVEISTQYLFVISQVLLPKRRPNKIK